MAVRKTGLRSISVRSSWGVVVDVVAFGDSTSAHCMCALVLPNSCLGCVRRETRHDCTHPNPKTYYITLSVSIRLQQSVFYISMLGETVPHEIMHM